MNLDSSWVSAAIAAATLAVTAVAVPAHRAWLNLKLENARLEGRVNVLERDLSDVKRDVAQDRMDIKAIGEDIGVIRVVVGEIKTAVRFLSKEELVE